MDLLDIKIRRRHDLIRGVNINMGKEWLLIEHNPIDFVLDGYGLINRKFLQEKAIIDAKDIAHKIINLKIDKTPNKLSALDLDDTVNLYNHLKAEEILIQVEFESDDFCLIGIVDKVNEKSFALNELSSKGEFLGVENIKFDTVRNIYIQNDYLESYTKYLNQ